MDRNVRLYTIYQVGVGLMFWVPVFFLYFSSVATLEQVLWLEALYYAAVVVFEVPSGYLSDRLGRRPTLVLSAAALIGAYVTFGVTASFAWFAAAQLLLALGMALRSGTDTSLLFESLRELGREGEMAGIEGRALARAFLAGAVASVVGGLLAGFELRIAYLLSAVAGAAALLAASGLREPAREPAAPPWAQVNACVSALRNRMLLWLSVFVVAMTVFNHVPWELTQPYVGFLLASNGERSYEATPAVVGALGAAGMVLASVVSSRVGLVRDRVGLWPTLLGAMALQGLVIAALSVVHPWLVAVLMLRSVPRALMGPVLNAAIHSRIDNSIRATFLSMQSLVGRLAFSATLLLASAFVGDFAELTPGTMRLLAFGAAAAVAGWLVVFVVVARVVRD